MSTACVDHMYKSNVWTKCTDQMYRPNVYISECFKWLHHMNRHQTLQAGHLI